MSADIERPPSALAPAAARRRHSSVVLMGALIGLTWSAALRGWMAQLAGEESSVTWLTLVFLLFPGALVGALLGRAADAQPEDAHRDGSWCGLRCCWPRCC